MLRKSNIFFSLPYRSPSQNQDKFEYFFTNLDHPLGSINEELPICLIVTKDFNARSSSWRSSNIANGVGSEIDNLISTVGYKEIIDKRRHIINTLQSCIDLIFCSNPNIISNHGVDI